MRKRYPVILLVVLVVALALSAALATADAGANPTFTGGNPACSSCHSGSGTPPAGIHNVPAHSGICPSNCAACHPGGNPANAPLPSTCAGCHTASAILAGPTHVASGCSTTVGCHGVTSDADADADAHRHRSRRTPDADADAHRDVHCNPDPDPDSERH